MTDERPVKIVIELDGRVLHEAIERWSPGDGGQRLTTRGEK